jgi:undecaprenyl-diphosphatase
VLATADRAILDVIQAPGTYWLDVVASAVSAAGPSEITVSIALGMAIVWLRHGRRDWWTPLLIGAVIAIEVVCKILVPHPSPPDELTRGIDLFHFLGAPTPYAFPSGHVARVAFLVTIARSPRTLGAALILVMALDKIYLGDHWPSETVGGWLLGYGVAAIARRT